MDWIDEQFIKIRNKVKNLPLLKAGHGVPGIFLQERLWSLPYLQSGSVTGIFFMWISGSLNMTDWEAGIWTFLGHWAGYFYMGASMCLMLVLFYHRRLKKAYSGNKGGSRRVPGTRT